MNTLNYLNSNSRNINGQWLPAKPVIVTLRERIVAAWLCLTGKAAAVRWY